MRRARGDDRDDDQVQLALNQAYQDALSSAGECAHGVTGGEIVRPWCGTPACAICRRRHPVTWWRIDRLSV